MIKLSIKCNFYWTWNTPLSTPLSSALFASGDFMCGVGVSVPEPQDNLIFV